MAADTSTPDKKTFWRLVSAAYVLALAAFSVALSFFGQSFSGLDILSLGVLIAGVFIVAPDLIC